MDGNPPVVADTKHVWAKSIMNKFSNESTGKKEGNKIYQTPLLPKYMIAYCIFTKSKIKYTYTLLDRLKLIRLVGLYASFMLKYFAVCSIS